MYDVTFYVIESKRTVTKKFSSPYLARRFVNKLKFSKKCKLLAYPIFKD